MYAFLSGLEAMVNWDSFNCWRYKVCKQKTPDKWFL